MKRSPGSLGWKLSLGLHLGVLGLALAAAWGPISRSYPEKIQLGLVRPAPASPSAAPPGLPPENPAPEPLGKTKPIPPASGTTTNAGAATGSESPGTGIGKDQPARPATEPRAVYPRLARQRGWEGEVLVEARINGQGLCTGVRIIQSSQHPVLDDAAVQAMVQGRFEPARTGGNPDEGLLVWKFTFRLQDEVSSN